jgi:hypothetical protein
LRNITCHTHGRRPWRGDITCTVCFRVYRGDSDGQPAAPERCKCGHRLMPHKEDLAVEFTARIVCHPCALTWDPS